MPKKTRPEVGQSLEIYTNFFHPSVSFSLTGSGAIRRSHEESLADAAHQLIIERDRKASLPGLQKQRTEKALSIDKDKRDRSSLIGKGSQERAKRFDEVSTAVEFVRSQVEQARRRRQALLALKDEVADTRHSKAPKFLRQLQQTHGEAGLANEQWAAFLLEFSGDVNSILDKAIKVIEERIRTLSGPTTGEVVAVAGVPPSATPLIPNGLVLNQQSLSLLNKEIERLRALIGVDAENTKAFARLSDKISRDEAGLAKIDRDIKVAQQADERIKELIYLRGESYAAVFDGIIEEEEELKSLYAPLDDRLKAETGALGKLSFSIRRAVDIGSWAQQGEDLLDLRKAGPFKGRGSLLAEAKAKLLTVWETGSSHAVAEAMSQFRESYDNSLVTHAPVERNIAAEFHQWAGRISSWLYGTDHIKVTYGVQYEGVDIEQLSPGTRGIVLLLLYLAIDRDDDRPLIIDQPEENLDPKSIYDELVERFRRAKQRRQIIIVTHNANLIVNTDADQVIVANCGSHRPGMLPEINYQSGGLENPKIRRLVCEILEGGETAFRERARRLRVQM